MLPGFRFLFIAVVLSVSMLIFGLGAAALLRATHEEFATLPLKQMPEVTFAAHPEAEPTLAVLQVDNSASGSGQREVADSQNEAPQIAGTPRTAAMTPVPAMPEIAAVSSNGSAAPDKVASLAELPSAGDNPVTDAKPATTDKPAAAGPDPEPQDRKPSSAAIGPAAPVSSGPASTPVATDAATVVPAADPVASQKTESQAVASLDTAKAVSSEPPSAGLKPVEPATTESRTAGSAASDAKIPEAKTPDAKTPDATVVATANTPSDPATDTASSEATGVKTTAAGEAKPSASSAALALQSAATDDANRTATATDDATVKVAALTAPVPLPVERPKIIRKASLTIKPATKKRIVRRRQIVQRARIVRPVPQRPANPFAGSPFGTN